MTYLTRAGCSLYSRPVQSSTLLGKSSKLGSVSSETTMKLTSEGISVIDPDSFVAEMRKCVPLDSKGAYLFKWNYLLQEILTKLPRPGVSPALRKERAVAKALEADELCKQINDHGYRVSNSDSRDLEAVLFYARSWIAEVLGPVEYSMFEYAKHGSGATTSRKRAKGDAVFKYSGVGGSVDITSRAQRYAKAMIELTPSWARQDIKLNVVSGNRIFTVPKKTDIDRLCAAEPDMNMYLQLAVGRNIRQKLGRVGINLRKQEINQQLAKLGSITGLLATIDLSSASDSISQRLVWDLLPPDWSDLLDDLRSPFGDIGGYSHEWAKISSMGNGFTFELETLIFASLLCGTSLHFCRTKVKFGLEGKNAVYGDDIICHSDVAPHLIQMLNCVGFKTNTDKTFLDGPFRESCGKHYYEGYDVSPFYIRKPVDNLGRIIWLGNALRRWATDHKLQIVDPAVWDIWRNIMRQVPKRFRGGRGLYGDSVLLSPASPKDRLVPSFDFKPRAGYPGLLTWFQAKIALDEALVKYVVLPTYDTHTSYGSSRLVSLLQGTQTLRPVESVEETSLDYEDVRKLQHTSASVRAIVRPSVFLVKESTSKWLSP